MLQSHFSIFLQLLDNFLSYFIGTYLFQQKEYELYNNYPYIMAAQIQQYPSLYHSPNKSEPDTQPDQSQQLLPNVLTHTFSLTPSSKLKSSLCKNFTLQGYCPYGLKCQFAHGPHQLRCNAIANKCYKTKPCFSFLKKEYCLFGHRCNFIHREEKGGIRVERALLQNFPELLGMAQISEESKLLPRLILK